MRNWPQTVINQYAVSPRMLALLEAIDEWISPDADLEQFYSLIWDIRPQGGAQGYGLDVWGRIVGVKRVLNVGTGSYFGFAEATDRTGFDQEPFYAGQPTTIGTVLSDIDYRRLIFAKAAYNITDDSIPAINAILMNLFPNRGNAYVTDGRNGAVGIFFGFAEAEDRTPFDQGPFEDYDDQFPVGVGNMTMIYTFEFPMSALDVAIVLQSGVLPKPAGVRASISYPAPM
jgi:uncharacterized protein DUF2612